MLTYIHTHILSGLYYHEVDCVQNTLKRRIDKRPLGRLCDGRPCHQVQPAEQCPVLPSAAGEFCVVWERGRGDMFNRLLYKRNMMCVCAFVCVWICVCT